MKILKSIMLFGGQYLLVKTLYFKNSNYYSFFLNRYPAATTASWWWWYWMFIFLSTRRFVVRNFMTNIKKSENLHTI